MKEFSELSKLNVKGFYGIERKRRLWWGEIPKPESESFPSSSQPTAPLYVLTQCCVETGGTAPRLRLQAPPAAALHLGGIRVERPRLRPDARVWRADDHSHAFPVIRER